MRKRRQRPGGRHTPELTALHSRDCACAPGQGYRYPGTSHLSFSLMVMMIHRSYATLLDRDDIVCGPFLFTVRCDLAQSASGTRQLPLPPPGLSP